MKDCLILLVMMLSAAICVGALQVVDGRSRVFLCVVPLSRSLLVLVLGMHGELRERKPKESCCSPWELGPSCRSLSRLCQASYTPTPELSFGTCNVDFGIMK